MNFATLRIHDLGPKARSEAVGDVVAVAQNSRVYFLSVEILDSQGQRTSLPVISFKLNAV